MPRSEFGIGQRRATTAMDASNTFRAWPDVIYPYVKSEQVFICPSAPAPPSGYPNLRNYKFPDVSGYSVGSDQNNTGSYAVNASYRNSGSTKNSPVQYPGNSKQDVSTAQIPQAASTILAGDGGYYNDSQAGWVAQRSLAYVWYDVNNGEPTMNTTIAAYPVGYMGRPQSAFSDIPARHLETANMLFCDGHVKTMKIDALLERGTGNGLRLWTIEED